MDKIVELIIEDDELDYDFDELGVEVISLVEEPAIESDFLAFNATSTCEQCSTLENRFELTEEAQNAILEYAEANGEDIVEQDLYFEFESAGEISQTDTLKSVIATLRERLKGSPTRVLEREPEIYYRYTGPSAQRKFCKAMMALSKSGRIFTEKQIDKMNRINAQFAPKGRSSYSIFEYNGGVNCVHYWQKLQVFKADGRKIIMTSDPANAKEDNAMKSQNSSKASPYGSIANNARLNFSIDEERKIVVGAVMIPNKKILRKDEFGNPYYVFFSESTIKKMAEKFFKDENINKTDLNHNGDVVKNNTLLESWIKEDEVYDKSVKYGFELPVGTWFASFKLSDEAWTLVKEGKIKGFSLAGQFIERLSTMKEEQLLANIKQILKDVKN